MAAASPKERQLAARSEQMCGVQTASGRTVAAIGTQPARHHPETFRQLRRNRRLTSRQRCQVIVKDQMVAKLNAHVEAALGLGSMYRRRGRQDDDARLGLVSLSTCAFG